MGVWTLHPVGARRGETLTVNKTMHLLGVGGFLPGEGRGWSQMATLLLESRLLRPLSPLLRPLSSLDSNNFPYNDFIYGDSTKV